MLASKVWTDEMPTVHRQFGIRINYLNYVRHQCDDLKERVAVVLDRYKEEISGGDGVRRTVSSESVAASD